MIESLKGRFFLYFNDEVLRYVFSSSQRSRLFFYIGHEKRDSISVFFYYEAQWENIFFTFAA